MARLGGGHASEPQECLWIHEALEELTEKPVWPSSSSGEPSTRSKRRKISSPIPDPRRFKLTGSTLDSPRAHRAHCLCEDCRLRKKAARNC